MADYLEEAAKLLRKASEANESRNSGRYDVAELRTGRMEIAREFAKLAAIKRGIAPADLEAEENPDA